MSNLNFESIENVTKNTSSKSSKKPTKKKQKPPMGVIIGVGIAVILGIVFLFSGGGKSLKRLPKPDSYMQGKLVESARTMNVPASEIWKFYCNHDPEGYLRYLESQYPEGGLNSQLFYITRARNFDEIDDLTMMALVEVYKKHPSDDEYWKSYKGSLNYYPGQIYQYHRILWVDKQIFWTGGI